MKKIFLIGLIFLLSSCTWSVIMNHTEGTASDVVDETQSNSVDVDANANLNPPLIK